MNFRFLEATEGALDGLDGNDKSFDGCLVVVLAAPAIIVLPANDVYGGIDVTHAVHLEQVVVVVSPIYVAACFLRNGYGRFSGRRPTITI